VGEVGDHDVGFAADAFDLPGDVLELRLCARRDHHVRTGFRERQRHRGAESAARSGHHRDLVVEPKSVQDHVVPLLSSGVTVTRHRGSGVRFLEHVLVICSRLDNRGAELAGIAPRSAHAS
jgi:hypothetical protein